jgi:glycosyltransferase involved in cell wall biosynthesis
MSAGELISIVLACRDQADHIGPVLRSYRDALVSASCPYELVVVPNACRDATPAVVAALAREDPGIRVVENPRGGWGLSVRMGLDAARGTVLCYTNSARTDPRHVVDLLALYRQHAPCLAKARRRQRGAPLREAGSWLYNLEGRLLFGLHGGDVNGTPKMFGPDLYRCLRLTSDGDLLDLELMAQVQRLGVPVVSLPVRGFKRHGGKSSTNLRSAWRLYTGAWRLRSQLASFPGPDA